MHLFINYSLIKTEIKIKEKSPHYIVYNVQVI